MKIGISSPVELRLLSDLLCNDNKKAINGIKGLGGTQPAQLAVQFIKMGHEVSIFTLSPDISPGQYKVYCGDNLKIYVGHFRKNKMCVLDFQCKEIQLLKTMINVGKPKVLSCHWTYEFALAGILSKCPTVITVRDWSPKILKLTRKPYRLMRMIMSFFVFVIGKKFIANSFYIEQKLTFLKTKIVKTIPNGINDSLFFLGHKKFNSSNRIRLISINNGFGKIKNVEVLIRAFSKLLKSYKDLSLFLVGDGFGENEDAYNWCKSNGLLGNVFFMGRQEHENVMDLLDNSDLLIHPALEESFGNILVEAMARKVPVIAGERSGAVPWVVKDSGLLVDVSSEVEIYKSILSFVENSKLLYEYSEKGYSNAFSRFRLSKIASFYLDFFRKNLVKL
jgi:L-malate glycosyltransferase